MMVRLQPEKPGDPTYRQIWRVVDGAVAQALAAHPEFVASGQRLRTVRNSIVKRVTGAIHGYAEQSAWVRSGSSPADDTGAAFVSPPSGIVSPIPDQAPSLELGRREWVAAPPAPANAVLGALGEAA